MATLGTLPPATRTLHPCCFACGDVLAGVYDFELSSERIFTERPEWQAEAAKGNLVTCSPAELGRMYFRIPWMWKRLYRAVVQIDRSDVHHRRDFCLSGVALSGEWSQGVLAVPRDPDEAVIGDPRKNPGKFVEAYYADLNASWRDQISHSKLCCYPIHERCWTLMERIIGPCIGDHLDLLVKALRRRQEHRQHGSYGCWLLTHEEVKAYEKMEGLYGDELYSNLEKHMQSVEKQFTFTAEAFSPRDPVNIIEVRDLINQAIHRRKMAPMSEPLDQKDCLPNNHSLGQATDNGDKLQKTTQKPDGGITRSSRRLQQQRQSVPPPPPPDIPLDIVFLILSLLQPRDIRNTLKVFQWWLPDSYWLARFPKEIIILEYDETVSEDLDWQFLYCGTLDLLESSHGLRNRNRIMRVLEETKEVFFSLMRERKISE